MIRCLEEGTVERLYSGGRGQSGTRGLTLRVESVTVRAYRGGREAGVL